MSLTYGQRRSLSKRADRLARQWDTDAADLLARVQRLERECAAERDAAQAAVDARAHRDIDSLRPGDMVRDAHGWHEVVRVNKTSVTVATGWSWTDRIPTAKVIETRSVK